MHKKFSIPETLRSTLLRGSLVGFLILALSACTQTKLYIANMLVADGIAETHADLQYGNYERQVLDIHLPASQSDKPTIVFIPGGCWGACQTFPKEDYVFFAEGFVQAGFPVAILNYRLYPEHLFGDQMIDVVKALEWLTENGKNYGLSDQGLVLMGHSAGAHLAAMTNFDERYLKLESRDQIKAFVGLAGPYDFLPFTEHYQPTLFGPPERYADSQPVFFVDGSEAPSLLLYGNDDRSVKPRNILSLIKKIETANGKVLAICYDGIDHGEIVGAMSSVVRHDEPIFDDIKAFIQDPSAFHKGHKKEKTQENRCQI